MLITEESDIFLKLVRMGIQKDSLSNQTKIKSLSPDEWDTLRALANKHGLLAVVLDGVERNPELASSIPVSMKLEWIGEVLQNYEARYKQYEEAIGSLAAFYSQHGFEMMVLKGYGLSLNYPRPNHRPSGDIDIWLFGQQKTADEALIAWFKVQGSKFKIDTAHHHHTVFEWQGFTVENHFDFLNVHHHKSNVEMEVILKALGDFKIESSELIDENQLRGCSITGCKIPFVTINGEKVYLPSANLHALFLLRHSMSNFASTGFQLRQLLDWGLFVEKHTEKIDWPWLEGQLEHFGMKKLYDIFNAICVGNLGFNVKLFPQVQFCPALKDRVLNDILWPEFSEKESGGFLSRAVFKYRRWKANGWKHKLCFSESMWSAFWSGVWGHLMKPASI